MGIQTQTSLEQTFQRLFNGAVNNLSVSASAPEEWPPVMNRSQTAKACGVGLRRVAEWFGRDDFPTIPSSDERSKALVGRDALWAWLNRQGA